MSNIEIKRLGEELLKEAHEVEKNGFPPDEAASLETLTYRQHNAPSLFHGYFQDGQLIGMVCGTRYTSEKYVIESMSVHQPNGENVCIHSVCVHTDHRRKGIALQLLKHYIDDVKKNQDGVKKILLVCKSELIPLYTKAGFIFVCRSDFVHGKDTWYDMEIIL